MSAAPDGFITRKQLVNQFRSIGIDISERTLKRWELQGLIPKADRVRMGRSFRSWYAIEDVPAIQSLCQSRPKLKVGVRVTDKQMIAVQNSADHIRGVTGASPGSDSEDVANTLLHIFGLDYANPDYPDSDWKPEVED